MDKPEKLAGETLIVFFLLGFSRTAFGKLDDSNESRDRTDGFILKYYMSLFLFPKFCIISSSHC